MADIFIQAIRLKRITVEEKIDNSIAKELPDFSLEQMNCNCVWNKL